MNTIRSTAPARSAPWPSAGKPKAFLDIRGSTQNLFDGAPVFGPFSQAAAKDEAEVRVQLALELRDVELYFVLELVEVAG